MYVNLIAHHLQAVRNLAEGKYVPGEPLYFFDEAGERSGKNDAAWASEGNASRAVHAVIVVFNGQADVQLAGTSETADVARWFRDLGERLLLLRHAGAYLLTWDCCNRTDVPIYGVVTQYDKVHKVSPSAIYSTPEVTKEVAGISEILSTWVYPCISYASQAQRSKTIEAAALYPFCRALEAAKMRMEALARRQ
jgi:hypothetical protein